MSIQTSHLLRGVILDIDGTLVDSNHQHTKAWEIAIKQFDFNVTYSEIRVLIGMGSDQLLPRLIGVNARSELGKEISERCRHLFMSHFLREVKAFPRSRDLVKRMFGCGFEITVATSADPQEVKALLEIAEVDDLIPAPGKRSPAEPTKPEPDVVFDALQRFHCRPAESIMIGDTPYDIEAARRAGVPCIALRSGRWSDQALKKATAIFDDVEDLYIRFETSPLGRSQTKLRRTHYGQTTEMAVRKSHS